MHAVMEGRTKLTLYWISVESNVSINHNPPLYMQRTSPTFYNNRCSRVVVMRQQAVLCISTSWFQLMAAVKSLAGFWEVRFGFMGPSGCEWLRRVSHSPMQVLLLGRRCWRITPMAPPAGCRDPPLQESSTLKRIFKAYRRCQSEYVVAF